MNYEKTAEPTDLCSDMGGKSSQKSRVKHQFYQPSIIGFILRCISLGDFLLPDWNDCKLTTQSVFEFFAALFTKYLVLFVDTNGWDGTSAEVLKIRLLAQCDNSQVNKTVHVAQLGTHNHHQCLRCWIFCNDSSTVMMLLLLSPILCSLVRVYQMRATIMDENFPAFGASICHENYRLRAVIRHSPYSCQHPLTRKTCNNHFVVAK